MRKRCMLALALLPGLAQAAVLRNEATLSGPVVRVGDIWDGAGAAAGRVLGPGPAPGGRIMVGAAQLAAIARQFGVDWDGGAGEQVVLERPGQALPVEAVAAALRPALAQAGASGEFDVTLPFYDPPMLDAGAVPGLAVESVALEASMGRFSAVVVTMGPNPVRLRVAGSIVQSVEVVLPTHRLAPGSVIGGGDVMLGRVRANLVGVPVATELAGCIGMQVRHAAFPGQPVPLTELARPAMVEKGARVMMELAVPGLDLSAVGTSLGAGAEGETVAVRNPVSGAVLQAVVTGPGTVRVDPDAPAAMPARVATLAMQ